MIDECIKRDGVGDGLGKQIMKDSERETDEERNKMRAGEGGKKEKKRRGEGGGGQNSFNQTEQEVF